MICPFRNLCSNPTANIKGVGRALKKSSGHEASALRNGSCLSRETGLDPMGIN